MDKELSENILIVEDDVIFSGILCKIIKPYFNIINVIANGNDAAKYLLCLDYIPSMILMDYRLPDVSGLEIISMLQEKNLDYPIIFLTAEGGTATAVEAMKKGAIDFLEKGNFNLKELPLMIKKNITIFQDRLEKKRLQKELEDHKNHLEELVQQRTLELEIHKDLLEDLVKLRTMELENTLNELKTAQSHLFQSEKMASLGTLLAGVAHEINNPINYINSSVSGLRNVFENVLNYLKTIPPLYNSTNSEINIEKTIERIEKMLINIETGIARTVTIVNSLRTFSRSSEGKKRETNIHESIDVSLTILYNQYKDRIKIKKEYSDIPLLNCFPDKINQVLMNLLINAIQSIEKKGEITISTLINSKKEKLFITIQDTGCGIPENIQSKIFDPFFTTKEPGKGTGLGLSIVYDIVKQHNGETLMLSTVGEGTTFTVILPINGE